MIKKYTEFIYESKFDDIESEYHSIGEYIEKVSKDNDYLLSIVAHYLDGIDTDIRISNAVNLLDDFDKRQLFYRIYNYLNKGENEKDVSITADVVYENLEQDTNAGKHTFVSFLKCITALGEKSITKSDNPKDGFLLYYSTKELNVITVKSIFNRFKSLSLFLNRLDYTFNTCSLYFGIKYDSVFEYGFYTDKTALIGEFKLNKSNLNWLIMLQSPSAMALKKDIVNLDIKKLTIFGKIALEMKNYKLDSQSKVGPSIKDDVITYGFYGVGKWDNGKLDDGEYQNLRTNFKNWLMKFRWCEQVLVSITHNQFWVYFNIKVK